MTAADGVKAAAGNVEAHTAEVDRLLADPASFAAGPGDWMRRFEQACAAEEEAVNRYGSAVLWADMDADRRAVARVPDVLRQPGAAHEAHARWEAAHGALTAAREAEAAAGQ